MKKFIKAFAIVIVASLAFTGCGNKFKENYYRPASFGENSQCYYVNDPAEVVMLQQQGFCDSSWRPVMAPTYWQARYEPYYRSSEYRDFYVPANRRVAYTQYYDNFSRTNSTLIQSEQTKAQYKDNKGTVVDGNKVPRGQFGGGVRSKGGAGIRGDNGKSLKKNHDDIVKKVRTVERKRKQDENKNQPKTGTDNKKSGSNGGGIRGGSGGSKSGSGGGSKTGGSAGRR